MEREREGKLHKILSEIKPTAPFIQEINCLLQFILGWLPAFKNEWQTEQAPRFSFYDSYTGALEVFYSFHSSSPASVEAKAITIVFFFFPESN